MSRLVFYRGHGTLVSMTDFTDFQLQVNVANPADVREKLPRAEKLLADMEREVSALQARVHRWRLLVDGLRSVAGLSDAVASIPASPSASKDVTAPTAAAPASAGGRAQMQGIILEAMTEIGRPIKSSALRDYLASRGHEFPLDSVSNALWYAADRGNIRKVQRGIYAPLDSDPMPDVAPPAPATVESNGMARPESAFASGARPAFEAGTAAALAGTVLSRFISSR